MNEIFIKSATNVMVGPTIRCEPDWSYRETESKRSRSLDRVLFGFVFFIFISSKWKRTTIGGSDGPDKRAGQGRIQLKNKTRESARENRTTKAAADECGTKTKRKRKERERERKTEEERRTKKNPTRKAASSIVRFLIDDIVHPLPNHLRTRKRRIFDFS